MMLKHLLAIVVHTMQSCLYVCHGCNYILCENNWKSDFYMADKTKCW